MELCNSNSREAWRLSVKMMYCANIKIHISIALLIINDFMTIYTMAVTSYSNERAKHHQTKSSASTNINYKIQPKKQ